MTIIPAIDLMDGGCLRLPGVVVEPL